MSKNLEEQKRERNTPKTVVSGAALKRDQIYRTSDGKYFKTVSHGYQVIIHQSGVGLGESPQRAVIDGRVKTFVRGNTIYTGNYGNGSKKVGTLVESKKMGVKK